MEKSLSTLFSNQTDTIVLEILCRAGVPLHLRGLAEIAELTASSVQASVASLTKSKLVKSKRVGQKRYFSINSETSEAKRLAAIVSVNENFKTFEDNPKLNKALSFALQLTDDVGAMRAKKAPSIPCRELFLELVTLLAKNDIKFQVTGELARSIYRHQVRTINSLELLISKKNQETLQDIFTQSKLLKKMVWQSPALFSFSDKDLSPISLKFISCSEINPLYTPISIGNQVIPFTTIEDALIQSCVELNQNQTDSLLMDDVSSIFESKKKLDLAYLIAQMHKNKVTFHPQLNHFAPSLLKRVSRDWKKMNTKPPFYW